MSPPRPSKRASFGPRLVVPLVVIAAIALADAGFRAWCAWRGEPASPVRVRERITTLLDEILARATIAGGAGDVDRDVARTGVAHPYTAFDAADGIERLDAELARRDAVDPNEYVVWIFGAESAGSLAVDGAAALVLELGRDDRFSGCTIRVVDRTNPSFKQPQSVTRLGYLLGLGLLPHAVINVDGKNEIALAVANAAQGVHPVHPSIARWAPVVHVAPPGTLEVRTEMRRLENEARTVAAFALDGGAAASAILGAYAIGRLRAIRVSLDAARARLGALATGAETEDDAVLPVLRGPAFEDSDVLETAARAWIESSRNLHALCRARGIAYLQVLEPAAPDELRDAADELVHHGVPLFDPGPDVSAAPDPIDRFAVATARAFLATLPEPRASEPPK